MLYAHEKSHGVRRGFVSVLLYFQSSKNGEVIWHKSRYAFCAFPEWETPGSPAGSLLDF
jgi:hypothetical protein